MDTYTDLLESMLTDQHMFFTRIANRIPNANLMAVCRDFFTNQNNYQQIITRILAIEQGLIREHRVVITDAENLLGLRNVVITPSPEQLRDAITVIASGESAGNCAVCQEAITGVRSRLNVCNHIFHSQCINTWFEHSVRCPVCRHDIREAGPAAQTSPVAEYTSSQS